MNHRLRERGRCRFAGAGIKGGLPMRSIGILCIASACGILAAPAHADKCVINFVSHGTFHKVTTPAGDCLQFVDDLGTTWDVTNPHGSWKDGVSGTIQAEFVSQPRCSENIGQPLSICSFTADFSGNIVGTLVFVNFVECPGFRIRTQTEDFFITNCEDFGDELCSMDNVGRHVQAQILVNSSPSICIDSLTTVIDFRFLQ
jgi:hypothetical protein